LNAYADTSFLISLYGRDPHSPAALVEVQADKPIFVLTPLVEVEFTNATELRVFYSFDERQRKLAATEGLAVRPSLIQRRTTTR
jgi:predicted nucleic acid-binding protein